MDGGRFIGFKCLSPKMKARTEKGEVRVCERERQADREEETEGGRGFISLTLIKSVQEY